MLRKIYITLSGGCVIAIFFILFYNPCCDNSSIIQGLTGLILFATILAMVDSMNKNSAKVFGQNMINQIERRILIFQNMRFENYEVVGKTEDVNYQINMVISRISNQPYTDAIFVTQDFNVFLNNENNDNLNNLNSAIQMIVNTINLAHNSNLERNQLNIIDGYIDELNSTNFFMFNEENLLNRIREISAFENRGGVFTFFRNLNFLINQNN